MKELEGQCIVSITTMHRAHVLVAQRTRTERFQTGPADMCLAMGTVDVVAPLRALDRDLAIRTMLEIASAGPLREEPLVLLLQRCAGSTFVTLGVAAAADSDET